MAPSTNSSLSGFTFVAVLLAIVTWFILTLKLRRPMYMQRIDQMSYQFAVSLKVVGIDTGYHRDLVSSYCDTEIRYWIELPLLASDYVLTLGGNIAKDEQVNANCSHSR